MLCAIVRMRISICVRDFACNIWQSALVTMYVTVTMSSSWAVLAAAFLQGGCRPWLVVVLVAVG